MSKTKNGKTIGRPPKDLDEQRVDQLAYQGCRNSEIAYILGVDDMTIAHRFSTILTKARARRRAELRMKQFEKAMQGDTTMLIWLGKNELKQTDKAEQKLGGTVAIKVEYEDLPPDIPDPDWMKAQARLPKPAPEFPIKHDAAPIHPQPELSEETKAHRKEYLESRRAYIQALRGNKEN